MSAPRTSAKARGRASGVGASARKVRRTVASAPASQPAPRAPASANVNAKPRAGAQLVLPQPRRVNATAILSRLKQIGHSGHAAVKQRFFKTGDGEYGEGDKFLGVSVPALRAEARHYRDAGVDVALPLLRSGWHEARQLALILLVRAFQKSPPMMQEKIYRMYLAHTDYINNWDLVDLSAEHIVGAWLASRPQEEARVLTRLARSKSVWERRIAMLATFYKIKRGDASGALRIATLLLDDNEDLIHKAVGWMLREVGERVGRAEEEQFLKAHYREMPRTMLRYAIEKFPERLRMQYLRGSFA
jgi:3-methyladenine DNA glycosylase AlkD